MSTIPLSRKSIEHIIKLCRSVMFANPDDDLAVEMVDGIAFSIQLYGAVSQKQAVWLCRNFNQL